MTSCWMAQGTDYGACCLKHAIQLFTFAGCRVASFAFLGAADQGRHQLVAIDRNTVMVDQETLVKYLPRGLQQAMARITGAAMLALDISHPGWRKSFGTLGRTLFDPANGFRIYLLDLGPKRAEYRYRVRPEDLVPRGEGPSLSATFPLISLGLRPLGVG